MPRVVVATTAQLAVDAATEITDADSNALDCVVAAALFDARSEFGAIENTRREGGIFVSG